MADQVIGVTIKGIGDFSDVVNNVNSVQKALTKLKIPDKLKDNLSKSIVNFTKEYDKYQQKITGGIQTQGDHNAINKSLNSMINSYQKIVNDFNKISPKDFKEIFKLDEGAFASVQNKIKGIQTELNKVKLDPDKIVGPLKQISNLTKSEKIVGKDGAINLFKEGISEGGISGLEKAKAALSELEDHYGRFQSKMSETTDTGWSKALKDMRSEVERAENSAGPLVTKMEDLGNEINSIGTRGMSEFKGIQQDLKNTERGAAKVTDELKNMHDSEFDFSKQVQNIDRQIQSYFGLAQMIRKVGNIAKDAFNTVKELDASMTETAVVTNFSVGDMWNMLPTYTEQANKLGSSIKDVYEAATLYYQQGLNTNQAMGLANETLKMARIAGMDAAEATDMMTAALRGFNMEVNQTSAQKVNDIYSQLAAVTASDTREIGTAMEKTASLASSANMKIETTSAFLAQMIETTREAPENLGTAMKTIIARFQEMKSDPTKLVDSEGVAMDVNKIDTALKSIGVQLTNTKGEFRDLDDVFLDISAKWDSLSQGQQRYIATTAAGSRQQSRFIAMMSNYSRTMELVDAANNSTGASQKQFEKTMDSMSSKLNQLQNAWDQFAMGLMNNQLIKVGITGLTQFLTLVNKVIDALSSTIPNPAGGITRSILTLVATLSGLNFAKNFAHGMVSAGAGWWNREGTLKENFGKGYYGTQGRRPDVDFQTYAQDLYQQKINNKISEKARSQISQTQTPVQIRIPVDATTYLEKVDASNLPAQVKADIHEMIGEGPITEEVRIKVNARLDNLDGVTYEGLKIPQNEIKTLDEISGKTAKATQEINTFGSGLTQAGVVLQQFGAQLGPFGGIISTIGSVMVSLGTTISSVSASLISNYAEAKTAIMNKIFAQKMEEIATLELTGAELEAATTEAALTAANEAGSFSFKALAISIWETLGPLVLIGAAIGAVVVAYKAWDAAHESAAEKLERLSDDAAKASEAYSSAKQATSELNDALEQIQNNEDSFQGLVAGTAEFNEKLIEANEKINELLAKYPELNSAEFLSTDENGLMHINEKGFDYIKKLQKQQQGHASALNTITASQLKTEENRQKAEELRKKNEKLENSKNKTVDTYGIAKIRKSDYEIEQIDKEIKANEQKVKYYEDSAAAAERVAQQAAIATSLSNTEVENREKIASIYADSYKDLVKQVDTSSKSIDEMRQAYADFYGYTYNQSTKQILDRENNVIVDNNDEGKQLVKDAFPEITVLANIEANGESLDKMMNTIDAKFAEGFNLTSGDSKSALTDILARKSDTNLDAVRKIAKADKKDIEKVLETLTSEEKAAILNITKEEFEDDAKKYTKQLTNRIKEDAKAVDATQAETRNSLAGMLAQSRFDSIEKALTQENKDAITKQIQKLTADQQSLLNTVGQTLNENVGPEAMKTLMGSAVDIFNGANKQAKTELFDILSGTSWDSAISRLEAYQKMADSSIESINNLGKSTHNAAEESNLLGKAFDEFLGGDWLNILESIDEFKNASGEIDSSGVLEMASQYKSLDTLLNATGVSATGLAKALQGIEDGSIASVNQTVLQLLSTINSLSDAATKAHNIIKNFDAGIDTGEGEDFIKENAEKFKEYYNNKEYGNEQLQNYIKLAAGTDKWNKALKDNKGNIEATVKALSKYVTTFSDGFMPAWEQMVSGKGINGKTLKENIEKANISEELKTKFTDVDFINDDGFLDIKIGDLTTEELQTYFEEIYGVSKEYASLLMQDLANYNTKIGQQLDKNNLNALVETEEFKNAHRDVNTGLVALSGSDLRAYRDAGGDMNWLATTLGYKNEADMWKNDFKTTKNGGEERTNYSALLKDYTEKFFGKDGDLFKSFESGYKQFDISKLMEDMLTKGMSDTQSLNSAFEAYKKAQAEGLTTTYNGMELKGNFETAEEFEAAISSLTESSQWVEVGETIGQQIVSAMETVDFLKDLHNNPENIDSALNKEGKLDQDAFTDVLEKLRLSNESSQKQTEDIGNYLGQSKEAFDKLSLEQKAAALEGIVNKLSEFKFSPEEISTAIKNGLGVGLDPNSKGRGNLLTDENGNVTLNTEGIQKQLEELKNQEVEIKPNTKSFSEALDGVLKKLDANVFLKIAGWSSNGLATGQNNPNSAFHRTGTMARGSRRGYTISGRPTLTGEEGEELVWEPKRNEAYMVGSKGPQFADISKDAVVWNADQTKRIKKNSGSVGNFGTGARGINNFGTMAGGSKIPGSFSADVTGKITKVDPPEETPKISVIGEFQFDKGNESGIAGKIKGIFGKNKENGYSIPVTGILKNVKSSEGAENTVNVVGNVTSIKNTQTLKGINATAIVNKVVKSGSVSGEPVTVKAKANISTDANTDNVNKKIQGVSKAASTTQKMTIDADNSPAIRKINKVISHIKSAKPTLKYSVSGPSSVSVPIYASFRGTWKKEVKISKSPGNAEKGVNNYISASSVPSIGSAASGHHGRLGPNGKGGPTLTGERGFEVAWLPSENRSMILGASGPQMIDLPSDAVIWTHEQSKRILSQKAIPAGSHANTSRRLSSGGSSKSSGSSSSGSSKKSSNKSSHSKQQEKNTKDAAKVIAKAGKISTWWDNQTRKIDAVQRSIDKNLKTFENAIKEFGATFKSTGSAASDYLAKLRQSISLNTASKNQANTDLEKISTKSTKKQKAADKQVAKAQKKVDKAKKTKSKKDDKKAKKELSKAKKKQKEAYGLGYEKISWEVTKVKKGKKTKVTKTEGINLGDYIKYDPTTGAYIVDSAAINKQAKKGKRGEKWAERVKEAANKRLETYTNRVNTAEDNITKQTEALEAYGEKIYETFVDWENELTKIWNITEKINQLEAETTRLKSALALQEAQLGSGLLKATKDFNNTSITLFKGQLKSMGDTVKEQASLINEQKNTLKELLFGDANRANLESVNAKLNAAKESNASEEELVALEQIAKGLQHEEDVRKAALEYLSYNFNGDGTVNFSFNSAQFEADKIDETKGITASDASEIQEYVKEISSQNGELNKSFSDETDLLADLYAVLEDLDENQANDAEQLLDFLNEEQEQNLEDIKKISESINNALKSLLDAVKQDLTERRNREDNAKTEADIAKKQQRLAALRADTSGGNAVEIAQLQKEISDAQESYGRTLEDQLLERLQRQADLAADQRDVMIELEEAILQTMGKDSNLAKVNEWFALAEKIGDGITEEEARKIFEEEAKPIWLKNNGYDQATDAQKRRLEADWESYLNRLLTYSRKKQTTTEQIKEVDTIANDTLSDNIVLSNEKTNVPVVSEIPKEEAQEIAQVVQTDTEEEPVPEDPSQTVTNAVTRARDNKAAQDAYTKKIAAAAKNKKIGAQELLNVQKIAKTAGIGMAKVFPDLAATEGLTWKQIIAAAKEAGFNKNRLAATFSTANFKKGFEAVHGSGSYDKAKKQKAEPYKKYLSNYKKGGLADFTGPAWLDGTPSKPELILNNTDTKNFLALRDVLSDALKTTNLATNNETNEFNIDISIEKIDNDYDVNRMVEIVKKEIVKSVGYRNVSQVRNFR